jgi:hypothetical protein
MFVIFGLVARSTDDYRQHPGRRFAGDEPRRSAGRIFAPPSWPWRRAALLLAGAAQLITVSALVGADPLAATWSSLLLAIAPALLAAAAAFALAPVSLLAAVAGIVVLAVGIVAQVAHTGLFSSRPWWCWLLGPSSSGTSSLQRGRRCEQMTRYLTRDRAAIAAASIAPLAAAAILLPFRASWPNTTVALLLVVVVVAVAAIGNRVAGAIAAIGAAVWFDFFFTLPYYRFTIRSSADVTTFVLLLVVGVAVSQLAAYARRLKVVAITDAGCLAQIHETAALAQTARFPEAVVDHVRQQLIGLLDLQECRFEYGSLLGHPPRLGSDGTVVAGHGRWDVEKAGLPGDEIELRAFGGGQYYGRFMMRPEPGSRPSLQARLVAITLADQAGRALAAGIPTSSTGRRERAGSVWG